MRHLFPQKICSGSQVHTAVTLNMKLLLVCMLLTSQFITLLALRNVTKQVYCTKQISAFSSLESQLQEPGKGKLLDDANYLLYNSVVLCHFA